jgi:hypothetical protein
MKQENTNKPRRIQLIKRQLHDAINSNELRMLRYNAQKAMELRRDITKRKPDINSRELED